MCSVVDFWESGLTEAEALSVMDSRPVDEKLASSSTDPIKTGENIKDEPRSDILIGLLESVCLMNAFAVVVCECKCVKALCG